MEMTKKLMAFLPLAFGLVLCFAVSADSKLLSNSSELQQQKITANEDQVTWCIAKPPTDDERLNFNIEYSCRQEIDCRPIQPGGCCFLPDNLNSHASYAMNLYYKHYGKKYWNCDFTGSGLTVYQDPSYGSCIYPA